MWTPSDNDMQVPHLLCLKEAADVLSISPSKLYRLAKKEGLVPYVQYTPHSELLFAPRDLLVFFQQSKVKQSVLPAKTKKIA